MNGDADSAADFTQTSTALPASCCWSTSTAIIQLRLLSTAVQLRSRSTGPALSWVPVPFI